jgi:demethylmenaquinone methyltransferase/2-methoxy-6-polyprenyl-1,4-benzoquinol methylase
MAFAAHYPDAALVGCDFSHGMLSKAKKKSGLTHAAFVEGDAGELPFLDGSFDVVICSHALYELKSTDRQKALWEMRRVLHGDGLIVLMEHEVPSRPFLRLLFHIRLFAMGSTDAREFVQGGLERLKTMFSRIRVIRSPSGKSRLTICQK